MKTTKFGKIQKRILSHLLRNQSSEVRTLYLLAFPNKEYTVSFTMPILMRLMYQGLIVRLKDGRVSLADGVSEELETLLKGKS